MGLDITAYGGLTKVDAVFDADGEPINPATREPLDWGTEYHFQPRANSYFPGREAGIEMDAVYRAARQMGFRAGSYGGYNTWRDELAKLAGYPAVSVDRYGTGNAQLRYDRSAWDASGGPFWELICFSDCEGVIGPVVSAKLAADFASHQGDADAHQDEWFRTLYATWRKAFEMAADNGAVYFH